MANYWCGQSRTGRTGNYAPADHDQGLHCTVCHPVYTFWTRCWMVKQFGNTFRRITESPQAVQIFRCELFKTAVSYLSGVTQATTILETQIMEAHATVSINTNLPYLP
ncbi:MAG: hypothetical protein N0E48_04460 [Candidatus Thiodiazotropha endolucinida]|nr:hypothetical protein [Candidatus Thiodiazotropha endolucinida]